VLDDGRIIPEKDRMRALVYSRIVGYLTPTSQWNVGKQAEWKDRKEYVAGGA